MSKSAKSAAVESPAKPSAKGKRGRVRLYESHVFVCGGSDCKKRGAKDVKKALKGEVKDAGLRREVRIDSVGCLGLCKHGPNIIVYPSGTWYLGLKEGDVEEVVERHLAGGEPVRRLAADYR